MDGFQAEKPDSVETTAFFTGHRILLPADRAVLVPRLRGQLLSAYRQGYRRFFCGCTLGFDTLAALETIRFRGDYPDVSLCLAIPCADQAARWPKADQAVYCQILALADEKAVLSPVYYRGCMLARNIYMADRSSLCICYLERMKGGTASAVRYAVSRNMEVVNLAVPPSGPEPLLKEFSWNCTSTFRSAGRSAATAPLRLLSGKRLKQKTMSP